MTPENKYIKLMYNTMLNDLAELPNKTNWASLVRHLLMSLGFYEAWLNQGVGNVNIFLSLFKQRLADTFMQNWRERLDMSTRATFYKSFANFQFQPYLDELNVFKYIQAFSKLRMSAHRLEIEAGRWARPNSIPVCERKCSLCKVLEDEYHFVLECSRYLDLRKKYIAEYYWKRPSMYKFMELINSSNKICIRNTGTYIHNAFKRRTEIVYRS